MRLSTGLNWGAAIPLQHRANFFHLTMDIAWFGVLNGSAIAFAAVFAARQGANAMQIGLLSATPALITMSLALPTGRWLQQRPLGRSVFWSSIAHRWFYLLWVLLPLLFAPHMQVWALIAITALMSIPGTAMAIGFNGLFAAAVPPHWRASVVGIRNAAYALTSILVTLACGWLLENLTFPLGYQVVFAIGFLAAMLSSYHLWHVRLLLGDELQSPLRKRARDWAQPGINQAWLNLRTFFGLRFFMQREDKSPSGWRFLAQNRQFSLILLLIFGMHLVLTMVHPLLPIYLVNQVQFNDQEIGLGNSFFYLALFLGSTQFALISNRLGHRRTLGLGMILASLYPLLIGQSSVLPVFVLASIWGGLAWSLAGGALGNFILEAIPEEQQAHYLAWYNIALQAGVLLGALIAPLFVAWVGIVGALIIATVGRLLSGISIWRLGAGPSEAIVKAGEAGLGK